MHILLKRKIPKNLLPVFFLYFFFVGLQRSVAQTIPSLKVTNTFNEQKIIYNNGSMMHTAWKPVVYIDSTVRDSSGTWFHRKFFKEHLVQVNQRDFNLNADLIFDEYIGASKRYVDVPMLNTRGYEITGNVSDKFYFETAFYENQARFGGYVDSFIRKNRVIPGQGAFKNIGDGKGFDFSSSSGRLVYIPSKHFQFDLGYGKNFIGDGYRSFILSDFAYNYPYFKTTINVGKFQYNVMWSQYISARNSAYNNKQGYFRKWSQTFFADYAVTKRFSLGVFETVMWPDQDTTATRNKDMSAWIASPIIFAHGSASPSGVPNNVIAGTNLKYRILNSTHLYGQFAIDQLGTSGTWQSRYAIQAGIRSGNVFKVENLNGLLEFNMARPYMYATNTSNTNFAHNNQSLAHPLGANFKEALFVGDYRYKSWYFRLESFVAKYGGDSSDLVNYGHNIFKAIDTRTVSDNVTLGQGLSTNILFADLKIAYILNPASNMRLETGFTYRTEKNSLADFKDAIFYIGIRMGFRKLYYDF